VLMFMKINNKVYFESRSSGNRGVVSVLVFMNANGPAV
jgi:hypothetical protein